MLLENGQRHEMRLLAEKKLAQVEARLDDLDGLRRLLKRMIAACAEA